MEKKIHLVAETETDRADKWLAETLALSRSRVQALMEQGRVVSNGTVIVKRMRLFPGQEIEVTLEEPKEISAMPEDIPLDVYYEDDWLLVVNKPKGMVVHPSAGHDAHTLVNALLFHCKGSLSGINGKLRPGIVHRIDKDTSGLLIVAKNDEAHQHLAAQIQAHSFKREYQAVACGRLRQESGTINAPIGRSPADRKKMAVLQHSDHARRAVTHYTTVAQLNGYTQVRLQLETGRTHQIRVHMAHIGHPIAGDTVYGHKKEIKSLAGQCLHAQCIGFVHPRTREYLEFTSSLPDYFKDFLHKIGG